MRIVVAMTGASGAVYGLTLLEELHTLGVETHLIVSHAARHIIADETDRSPEDLKTLATFTHDVDDLSAPVASGSFPHDGMVVAPCSMRTCAAIAHGLADNLITRAADVAIKEQRRLILLPREAPLSALHLENMLRLARLGVIIFPPVPAFYLHPRSITEMVRHTVARILDLLGLPHRIAPRWPERLNASGESLGWPD
ncbi:MAG: UbiX family flavin prenyltransferase [Desulfotomaculales bacterium]